MFNQPSIVTAVVSFISLQSNVKSSGATSNDGGVVSGVIVNTAEAVVTLLQASVAVHVTVKGLPAAVHTSSEVTV